MADETKQAPTQSQAPVKPQAETEGDQPKPEKQSKSDAIQKGIAPELESDQGKAKREGQPQKAGEPGESTFLDPKKGIDPSKLPDELKQTYNSMLTDYKRKTQELSEERGKLTQDMRDEAVQEALNNLDNTQFNQLVSHPSFQRQLASYLNTQGLEVNGNAQGRSQETGDKINLDELTDTERQMYETIQRVEKKNRELETELGKISDGSRMASIQSQDAQLQAKYGKLYDSEKINSFLKEVQSGRRQLTREDIFKIVDYQRGLHRAFEWGKRENYEGDDDRQNASMLSSLSGGGEDSDTIPKRQKGESHYDFFQKVYDLSKKQVAMGKNSPYIRR